MAYADFCDVFGNLELMVMNLVETVAYTITFTMMWLLRCNNLLKRVIDSVKRDMAELKFEDVEEERIYCSYNYTSRIFFYTSEVGMWIAVMLLYFRPLINFTTMNPVLRNSTASFVLPYRVRTFFDIPDARTYALAYLCLLPMSYLSICHMSAICLLVILILHICGKLSILTYRIRSIGARSSQAAALTKVRDLVRTHLKIIWMARSVDDAFNVILLDELLGHSVILAISTYYVITNLSVSEMTTCCTFVSFAGIALVILYGYCLIGDQLTQQCVNMQDAYYECDWYEMPHTYRRCMLICMLHSRVMLYLTAGKFYVFSLNSFTDIIKSSLAYLSMLRTLL